MVQPLDLEDAQRKIIDSCQVLSSEKVGLSAAPGRIAARPHLALSPLPGYDASLRDGYAIGAMQVGDGNGQTEFQVTDLLAAGDLRRIDVGQGEAVRIMTGAQVPDGCQQIIPQEDCTIFGRRLTIALENVSRNKHYIHRRGCDIAEGETIVEEGTVISCEQQVLLAGCGYVFADVVKKAAVRFFCTGSELVATGSQTAVEKGQRFSANGHLLSGLIERCGGVLQGQEFVDDDIDHVSACMQRMVNDGCDVLLSTGGMGPGKFDLTKDAFIQCGGEIIFDSLRMRPGKAILFGKLDGVLFFGLPGPPPAVQLLFHALVRPALVALQGASFSLAQKSKAKLTEKLPLGKHGLLRLKSGYFSFADGYCLVRPARKKESANCYIYCPSDVQVLEQGDVVDVYVLSA